MYSPEAREMVVAPATRWLTDSRMVIYDVRKPPKDRGVELLDPKSGKRTTLIDQQRVVGGLKSLLGEDATPTFLPFPQEIDGEGNTALYVIKVYFYLNHNPT
jgi:hypothetical protein